MLSKTAFASACILSVTFGRKYQTFAKDHHLRSSSNEEQLPSNSPVLPENSHWEAYWADYDSNMAFGDVAKCMSCSLAMAGVDRLLEVPFVHNGILTLASYICDLSGVVGHRFEICPQLVSQFGEPLFTVVESYIFTRDRICNEHFGLCSAPVITEINLNDVVKNILATKPVSLQNDDYI